MPEISPMHLLAGEAYIPLMEFETADVAIAAVLNKVTGQRCAVALRPFATGEKVASFSAASAGPSPSKMTVQISEQEHIELFPEILSLINHSCDPNVHFDVNRSVISACRPIAAGDEITFFYPSTEWLMAMPFECTCQTSRCAGRITGASQMALQRLQEYCLPPHILRLAHATTGSSVVA